MITKDEIQELLHSTETYRVERTTSTGDMDKFQEAICAFANDLPNSRKKGYRNARPENFPSVNDYRNPLIASAMNTMGYVNMFNRGVGQVQADLKENGNQPAEFNVNLITAFKVDVKVAQNYVTENGGNVGGKADVDTVAEKLTERQKDILAILRDVAAKVAVNTKYLSERMHVNRKTIQRDIVGLQEQNLVQWVGSDKNGHWEIINSET